MVGDGQEADTDSTDDLSPDLVEQRPGQYPVLEANLPPTLSTPRSSTVDRRLTSFMVPLG